MVFNHSNKINYNKDKNKEWGIKRTSVGKFSSKSPWNEDYVLRALQQSAIKKIWQLSKDTGKPIYMIIDDTICKKTKPSSRAKNLIEKC